MLGEVIERPVEIEKNMFSQTLLSANFERRTSLNGSGAGFNLWDIFFHASVYFWSRVPTNWAP